METDLTSQSRREDRLLRNVLFTFFIGGACAEPLGSFIPFLRQAHGLSYDLSGLMLSCQSVGNVAAILAAGLLPAYLGRRRTILTTAVWMAAGYLIFAGGFGAPAVLFLACLMTGFARGGNANFSNTMVSTLPPEKNARGYNLLHCAFGVGALLSPLLLIFASTRFPANGWRAVAALLGVAALVQLLVYGKMPLPQEKTAHGSKALDWGFLRVRQFWLSALMLFFYISAEYAICGWLVTYFQDMGVLSAGQSHMMNSLYWLMLSSGRLLGALLNQRLPRRHILLVIDGMGTCGFFFLMFFSSTPLPVVIGLGGAALFMATIYPTIFALGNEAIRGNDLGCSAMLLIASSGGILSPALIGMVAERAGIRSGMAVIVVDVILLLAAIALNALLTHAGRETKEGV